MGKILAIDPGTTHSGVVVYDADVHAVMSPESAYPNAELLEVLRVMGNEFRDHLIDRCVIEDIQAMGMIVGNETFQTAKWIGRFQEAWDGQHEVVAELVGRGDEKIVLCGCNTFKDAQTGKRVGIKDTQIKQAVLARFPATGGGKCPAVGTIRQPGPLWNMKGQTHAWQALAVALTYCEMAKENSIQPCESMLRKDQ